MAFAVDWTYGEAHMLEVHGVSAAQAQEALIDERRVVIDPDYNSISGDSFRVIGMSASFGDVISVIVVKHVTGYFGANGWRANAKDKQIYAGGERYG